MELGILRCFESNQEAGVYECFETYLVSYFDECVMILLGKCCDYWIWYQGELGCYWVEIMDGEFLFYLIGVIVF